VDCAYTLDALRASNSKRKQAKIGLLHIAQQTGFVHLCSSQAHACICPRTSFLWFSPSGAVLTMGQCLNFKVNAVRQLSSTILRWTRGRINHLIPRSSLCIECGPRSDVRGTRRYNYPKLELGHGYVTSNGHINEHGHICCSECLLHVAPAQGKPTQTNQLSGFACTALLWNKEDTRVDIFGLKEVQG